MFITGKNQMVGTLQPPIQPLQPHQGRNPCMERNLIRDVPTEPSVSGNTLIDLQDNSSPKATLNTAHIIEALEAHQALDSNLLVNEHLVPLLNGFVPSTQPAPSPPIVQPQPILNPPIPYLQNEVNKIEVRPKKQNVPQEKHSNSAINWHKWKINWGDKIHSILPKRRGNYHHHHNDEEKQEILFTPTSSSHSEPQTPLGSTHSTSTSAVIPPSNLDVAPRQTEVLLTNGNPQTNIMSQSTHSNNNNNNI